MFEARLIERLMADNALSASIESIMEGPLAQRSAFPCITLQRVATGFIHSHSGRLDLYPVRTQFNCWDESPQGARAVAALVIDAIATFDLTQPPQSPEPVLTVSPNKVLMQLASVEPEPEPVIFREILDCTIWYRET